MNRVGALDPHVGRLQRLRICTGGGGSVRPGPCSSSGTGGPRGAGELIASLSVDAE